MKVFKILDDNRYSVQYDPEKEWEHKFFRGSEDITARTDNLTSAMFYMLLRQQEKIEKLEKLIANHNL